MTEPRKRLAVFVPSMRVGGAERSMLKLAHGLAERDYDVDLVLARAEGPHLAEVRGDIRVVDLKAARVLTSLAGLVRYLRNERPLAMLSVMNYANIVAVWARRLAGVSTRLIVSERITLSVVAQQSPSWRGRWMPLFVRLFYPWADGIVAVSEGVADDLSHAGGLERERIQVIYNPILTPELLSGARADVKDPWFEPGQPPVVLAVGRLMPQKDFATLVRAFAQVRQNRSARLLILGEGPEREKLEALVKEFDLGQDVRLPGFVEEPYAHMARASVFVLSSQFEGLPGVLIEAMCCGAPLVATDCPSGPREILKDGEYGGLVPVEDVTALARAMEKSLDGETPAPPPESYQRFELQHVVDQYIGALCGD